MFELFGNLFHSADDLSDLHRVAKQFPGSMAGAQNTTNQVGSFLSGVLFGYVAKISGSYDRPLFLLALMLGLGALLWFKINPEEELVPED